MLLFRWQDTREGRTCPQCITLLCEEDIETTWLQILPNKKERPPHAERHGTAAEVCQTKSWTVSRILEEGHRLLLRRDWLRPQVQPSRRSQSCVIYVLAPPKGKFDEDNKKGEKRGAGERWPISLWPCPIHMAL